MEDKEQWLFPGMSVLTRIIQKLTAPHFQASDMAQRVEVIATKPNDPSDSLKW